MLALGIDIGTSGVRTAVLDRQGQVLSTARTTHFDNSGTQARAWWDAVAVAITAQVDNLIAAGIDPHQIKRAAIDGTSGSIVLVDDQLNPVTPALMYNSSGFTDEAALIDKHAEPTSITRGSSSSLARMLRLQAMDKMAQAAHLLHQADYALAMLAGKPMGSDDNNALKLGWDPHARCWPDWFEKAGVR
ncbi:MAG: FGGY family carbohydrate kinase, partial [Pseudomonadota bacterium]